MCEWWYNVYCENSDKLYHKNAQLYQTNGGNQNKDNNNVETNWNHNRDNNNNYKDFRNNHYNDDDRKNANNFKISSNARERYSLPNDRNDDEINVDFSNEEMSESKDKLFKTKLNDKLVSNINLINKTKSKI